MPQPRKSDLQKKLGGTYRESRSLAAQARGRTRLEAELPPPSDLDASAKQAWRMHIRICIELGTVCSANLLAFVSMVKCAAALERAYREAMRDGPVVLSAEGSKKASPAWALYLATDGAYRGWCKEFGLTPQAQRLLPVLPPATGTPLRVVEG